MVRHLLDLEFPLIIPTLPLHNRISHCIRLTTTIPLITALVHFLPETLKKRGRLKIWPPTIILINLPWPLRQSQVSYIQAIHYSDKVLRNLQLNIFLQTIFTMVKVLPAEDPTLMICELHLLPLADE